MSLENVDATTFDHHCERCQSLRSGVPHAEALTFDLRGGMQPGGYAIYIDCPACGSRESFNTGLDADDVAAGPTHRRRQALLIRTLQQRLGLPML